MNEHKKTTDSMNEQDSKEKYVEMAVPINKDAQWYKAMKDALKDITVKWQNGNFHITLVFIKNHPDPRESMRTLEYPMNQSLKNRVAPIFEFDTLDVFTTMSGREHIVNLTCSQVPEEFMEMEEKLRKEWISYGAEISDFRLHVTLGRIPAEVCSIDDVKKRLARVDMPSFKERIWKAEFKELSTHKSLGTWTFHADEETAKDVYRREYLHHFRNACGNIGMCDRKFWEK